MSEAWYDQRMRRRSIEMSCVLVGEKKPVSGQEGGKLAERNPASAFLKPSLEAIPPSMAP